MNRKPKVKRIYVISSEDGPVKIGISNNPNKRKITLERSGPSKLRLEYDDYFEGVKSSEIEDAVKALFSPKRKRGEWFNVTVNEAIEAIKAEAAKIMNNMKSIKQQEDKLKEYHNNCEDCQGELYRKRRSLFYDPIVSDGMTQVERLESLKKRWGVTWVDLAKALGVRSMSTMDRWRSGEEMRRTASVLLDSFLESTLPYQWWMKKLEKTYRDLST